MKKHFFLAFFILLFPALSFAFELPEGGEPHMFTITGYYSPLPNQTFYVTGSYQSEIALNGNGLSGADGTAVYPGMIAAPSVFPFGTKICIPNLGCGMVHDRGGAIVKQGQTSLAKFDRIDIWMGYGDEGLRRALAWGVQHLETRIFPENADVQVAMDFTAPPSVEQILDMPKMPYFSDTLSLGDKGDTVLELQKALTQMGFFTGELDSIYSKELKQAVLHFQMQNYIVPDDSDAGAGVFGPRTREKLALSLYKILVQEKLRETWDKFHFESDIRFGERNEAVWKLQEFLVKYEFLDTSPTGYFGNSTLEALKQFQVAFGLVSSPIDSKAGVVDEATRDMLNTLLEKEKTVLEEEQKKVMAYQKSEQKLSMIAGKTEKGGVIVAQN